MNDEEESRRHYGIKYTTHEAGVGMKNWITFISVFFVSLALVITIIVVWNADAPFADIEKQAEKLAIEQGHIVDVTSSYTYNGQSSYVTIFGVDENGDEKAVFVPKSLEEEFIQEVLVKDGITKEQALDVLSDEAGVKELLHAKLGFEKPGAVWELTYLNDQGQLNYVYILHSNGEWWKRILNL